MNLNRIAGGAVASVNPFTLAVVRINQAWTIQPDGKRVPTYLPPVRVAAQVQSLTYRDLQQVEALNLQGTRQAIYLNGHVNGLVRNEQKGGDLITMLDGEWEGAEWLVAMVLEDWGPWCKVAVTLQRRPNLAPAAGA